MPVDCNVFAQNCRGEMSCLVYEAGCLVAAEEISNVEASALGWDGVSGEGKGVCCIQEAASLVLAIWKEA